MLLNERIALVTGAGQGVGEGIARRLHEAGATVIIAEYNPDGVRVGEGEAGEVAAKTMLSDTEGVTRDVGEESVEEIVRRAKRTPKFWSGDNPVLVGAALSIGAAGLFGVIPH